MTIHGATPNQMIGLGGTSKDMHITDAEMSRMTANGGFTLGSSAAAGLVVDGISASSSDTHARIVLDSTQSSGTVEFASFLCPSVSVALSVVFAAL